LQVGSPERPLSDLGAVSYRSYWGSELLRILRDVPTDNISIIELATQTSIRPHDIITTLRHMGLITQLKNTTVINISKAMLQEHTRKEASKKKNRILIDFSRLHWTPLLVDVKRDKWSLRSKRQVKDSDDQHIAGM